MIAATGGFGQALEIVRDLFGQSETWQEMCDSTSAEDFVYIGEIDAEDIARPHAIVCRGPGEITLESVATGYSMTYSDVADISVFIETTPTEDLTDAEQYMEALNWIEALVQDLALLSGGIIHFPTITIVEGPLKIVHQKEKNWGTYFGTELRLSITSSGAGE